MQELLGLPFDPTVLDTVTLARVLLPNLNRFKLDTVAKALGVSLENHHRAVDDAEATAGIFLKFVEMLKEQHDMTNLDQLEEFSQVSDETIMKMPTYHVIILAKNDLGRVNLYRLVSWSHLRVLFKEAEDPEECAEPVQRRADHRISLRGGRALSGNLTRGPGGGACEDREFLRLSGDSAAGQQCVYAPG